MIVPELIRPASIAVVGASGNTQKPGGKVLANLQAGAFAGPLYPVNPKERTVQGLEAYASVEELPSVELAILAIPAKLCPETVRILAERKGTRGFIILSAGFSEESEAGAALERKIVEIVSAHDGGLIGPNCIGVLTPHYNGVFTTPIPTLEPQGCDFISGSGATAVFIMEAGIPNGLTFAQVFSVGNSAQIGVEEALEYLDENFDPAESSRVKLLYIESISRPQKLLKHARSLISKGCRIAAIKAGSSVAGSRAASSHTGALAGSDAAVDALFEKAGIVRCYSREELAGVAAVLRLPRLPGPRLAVITHAGGPAVMLTDALSHAGLEVPSLSAPENECAEAAEELREALYPGSSTANPIDFLATGTAEQLGTIIEYCETRFSSIDAMIVIFGSPGLFGVEEVYEVLREKMRSGTKPIYPVLPSLINAKSEIEGFLNAGGINFPDEVTLARALARVYHAERRSAGSLAGTPAEAPNAAGGLGELRIDRDAARTALASVADGYTSPETTAALLDAAGIARAREHTTTDRAGAVAAAQELGFPVVMKVVGPIHKSDLGGVVTGVSDTERVATEFERLMRIEGAVGVLLQPMLEGLELFAGVIREPSFGHMIVCGLGGIFVEVFHDVKTLLAPVTEAEALGAIRSLQGYPLIQGTRGSAGTDERRFAETVARLSALVQTAPEIAELDLNPLLANREHITAVDARIRIERSSAVS